MACFSLYDHNPLDEPRLPWLTWGLIALTSSSFSGCRARSIRTRCPPQRPDIGLITSMFMHSG
jgi:hypothetical protein